MPMLMIISLVLADTNASEPEAQAPKAEPKTQAKAKEGKSVQSIKLKDGNILKGEIIAQDKETVTLKTSLGVIAVRKASIAISEVILELDDNSVLVGKLIAESEKDYSILTSFAVVKVERSRVLRLTTKEPSQRLRRERARVVGDAGGGSISRIGKPTGQFSHTIEPLIDIFFEPLDTRSKG